MRRASGFTLLEVMVALAILAIALTAIVGINGNSISAHDYSKRVTIATLLARSKLADLESQFNEEGFTSEFDQVASGDFSEEGWQDFRWEAEIIKPDLDAASTTGLVQNLIQQFTGNAEQEARELAEATDGPTTVLPGIDRTLAAQFAPMIETQVTSLVQTMEQSIREVRLRVYWMEGRQQQSVDVTTHFVYLPQAMGTNIPGRAGGPPPPVTGTP